MASSGKLAQIAEMFSGGERWSVETGVVRELYEDEDGHFAMIAMGAEEEEIAVARAMLYVGDMFGMFVPLEKDQEVPVFIPANDTNRTPITFGVLGANNHKVPDDVLENPDDFWLIMKPGQNVRIRTSGDTNETSIVSKLVKLGSEDPDDKVVMWSELKKILANFKSTYDGHTQTIAIGAISVDLTSGKNTNIVSVLAPSAKVDTDGNIAADMPASSVVKGIL